MPISRAQMPQQISGQLRGSRPSKAMRKKKRLVDNKRKRKYISRTR